MDRKRNIGDGVAYLLATVAGTRWLSVIAPVIMWSKSCGYADESSSILSIQSEDAVSSALIKFTYIVFLASLVRKIEFLASSGRTVLDLPSAGMNGDWLAAGSTSELTITSTEVLILSFAAKENKEKDLNNATQNHDQD